VRFPVLTGERWVDARELELFRHLYAPARVHFTRAFSLGRFPWLTTSLCILQIVLYFGIAGAQRIIPLDPLIAAGAKMQPNILELGETWRLLVANVLHRDVLHLVFNMFFLFNVGGTIENAYRLRDYALILIASAIATTVTSTFLSSVPSVGSSGVVLGLFGSASVFGYKYSDILPTKYRRYFGGAVLPYALFILYVGLATKDTDNWGHLGGMIGGLLATMLLDPKLLHVGRGQAGAAQRLGPVLASCALVAGVLVAGPMIRSSGPSFEELADEKSGARIAFPSRWTFGENQLGFAAWGNTLGASIGISAERRTTHPLSMEEVRKRFLSTELRVREREGDIASVSVEDERPFLVEGGKGVELEITLESRAGPLVTRNFLIARGYYSYAIVLSAPAAWAEAYAPIFDRMVSEIRLIEPEDLTRAKRVVSTFPGMSSAHVELGHQLASIGRIEEAEQSYQRALEALPEHAEALYGIAKLSADYGHDLENGERIADDLHRKNPEDPGYATLLADLEKRLGQIDEACDVLQETLDRVSDPPEDLRERLRDLGCRAGAWLDR
jgi:membrane associated rhomboid family serine protease/cytochrome c-type biogenesis protein CcmH/NrfG